MLFGNRGSRVRAIFS